MGNTYVADEEGRILGISLLRFIIDVGYPEAGRIPILPVRKSKCMLNQRESDAGNFGYE